MISRGNKLPRFYFNVRDGRDFEDAEGTELPDLQAARREAIRLSGAILEHETDHIDVSGEWKLEVTDETGVILLIMTFLITQSSTPSAVVLPWRGPKPS